MFLRRFLQKFGPFLLLSGMGILLNMGGVWLVRHFELPLYLDSVGTLLTALVGGYLPGVLVGYFSNLYDTVFNPMSVYYAFINVLLALAMTRMTQAGFFRRVSTTLLAVVVLSFIGGGLGSLMTWLLYGLKIGSDVSSPYAYFLFENLHFPKFYAQLAADMLIDLMDKGIALSVALTVARVLPFRFLNHFEFGRLFARAWNGLPEPVKKTSAPCRKMSLHTRLTLGLGCVGLSIGFASVMVGSILYKNVNQVDYLKTANGIVGAAASIISADAGDGYLATGRTDAGYRETAVHLKQLQIAFPMLRNLSVYQIRPDGCHVAFDLDSAGQSAVPMGAVVPFDPDLLPFRDDFLAGRDISPMITRSDDGAELLTVCRPVRTMSGECVAYVRACFPLDGIRTGRIVYLVKMFSLLFGLLIVFGVIIETYTKRVMVAPLNAMAMAAAEVAYLGEKHRLASQVGLERLDIRTGDEIENLYLALCKTSANVTRSENEKRIILDNIRHPLGLFDENCCFLAGNAAIRRLHGNDRMLDSPEKHDCQLCGKQQGCLLRQTAVDFVPHEAIRNIGEHIYHVMTQPVDFTGSHKKGIVISFVDVTEVHQAKRRMQDALTMEKETNRDKNSFLASIGHELKTPLNAIVGFSDLLSSDQTSVTRAREYVDAIRQASRHLQSLFDGISELMRLDPTSSDNHVPCDLRLEILNLQDSFRKSLDAGNNQFRIEISDSLPRLLLDVICIRQILFQFIHNACKYTESGTITVSSDWRDGNLRIACRDTGIGIPVDKQEKIFTPFYQVDSLRDEHKFRGSGLGLALAGRFAKRMGGSIELESCLGQGSTFTLVIPAVKVAAEPIAAPMLPETSIPDGFAAGLRVLALDDIPLNVMVMTRLCEKIGLRVFGAACVDDAFRLMTEQRINLVLTDMWMPDMNGTEFAAKIRSMPEFRNISIYAVTADSAVRENFDLSAFNGILQKPVGISNIRSVISEVYRKSQPSRPVS